MKRTMRARALSVLFLLCGDGSSFCFLARSSGRTPQRHRLDDYGPPPPRARIKLQARKKNSGSHHHHHRQHPKSDKQIEMKMKDAKLVEKLLNDAVSKMERMTREQGNGESMVPKLFPSGRCQGRGSVALFLHADLAL